jgi:hypothetical protein
MIKNLTLISTLALFSTAAFAADDVQAQIDALNAKITKMEKINKYQTKKLSKVNKQSANDNIKFSVDFRNAVDVLDYKTTDLTTGETTTASNNSLLTSRLYLDMAASPMEGLIFKGRLAIYAMWGAHLNYTGTGDSAGLKDWSASSKATDTVMRVKEAYFVYSNKLGSQPVSFSIGRRPSTNGFLANYRENEKKPGSPQAHTTNMEVNAAMVKLSWDRFIEGAYTKFVYGRAHTGEIENVYGVGTNTPYATVDGDDKNVDFFVMPGNAYDDGQYQVMYQWAHIFNTKGLNIAANETAAAAGAADLLSAGIKVDGIGDEWSDFLDETTVFVSGAYTYYNAKDGYQLLNSDPGGSQSGSSVWVGAIIPDMITENGKFGFEYNHGSKYWTPMTWAEDTAIGSKIAVRGDAYEAYWNFNLFGVKYLPSQVRYTYAQHDYTPNVRCAGWIPIEEVDITASDLRFAVSYRY